MAVQRWVFTDPVSAETYTVPLNPREMSSPFGQRPFNVRSTVALNGRPIVTEGSMPPTPWQFSGAILDAAHYEKLRYWTYDIPNRITVTDHFGRAIDCLLERFEPTPKRAVNVYWRHEYTISGLVFRVGTATVGV